MSNGQSEWAVQGLVCRRCGHLCFDHYRAGCIHPPSQEDCDKHGNLTYCPCVLPGSSLDILRDWLSEVIA